MISERWQSEVAETVFDTINQEADKAEAKKKSKHRKFDLDEKGSKRAFSRRVAMATGRAAGRCALELDSRWGICSPAK